MVEVGTGDKSSKFLKESYPIEDGLTAGTTKTHDRQTNLIPESARGVEGGSNIPARERVLL